MSKDYYSILGVDRKASASDIKKSYRKLARKYHPDLNPKDKSAESRFKEIQGAYAVLSDPKKKAQYDRFGFVGDHPPGGPQPGYSTGGAGGFEGFNFSDFGSASFQDFFSNIFGGAQQRPARGPVKGDDLQYTMRVGFMDAINGLETRIRLTRMAACGACGGQGHIQKGGKQTCPTCGGSGQTTVQSGAMRFATPCRTCRGSGIAPGQECPTCHGQGQVQKTETIKVRIPAGVDTGSRVRIPGKGNAGTMGGGVGDLFISIEVDNHRFFRREGTNIYVKLPITITEATLGAKIEVPTVYGSATIKIPPGTRSGQKFRLRDKGIPKLRKRSRGDQFTEVYIVPPPFDNQRVRELVKEIGEISEENPRAGLET